jgi:hypothetical protein
MSDVESILGLGTSAAGTSRTASNLSAALSNVSDSNGILSAIRSLNLPAAGEAIGDIKATIAQFSGHGNENDWRVRISLPTWTSFRTSPVFKPLVDAGGFIFPYTPTIQFSTSATYTTPGIVHSNHNFRAFKNSDAGAISINAPMNVEDSTQGAYWVAGVHFFRALTKMFSGDDPKAGNPPPIVYLNGYGNYVLKNIPVVVTKFAMNLDAKCDYIGVDVVGSAMGGIASGADNAARLGTSVGNIIDRYIPGVSRLTGTVNGIAGAVGQITNILGSFGIGGAMSGGITHVPTKSSFTVTVEPVYSRDSMRKFSLDRFVAGGYITNRFGYI